MIIKDSDFDFDVEKQFTREIQKELYDKMISDSTSNTEVSSVQVDTLCEYIKLLIPPTLEVEIERAPYGCILDTDDDYIFVIITPDDITVKSFEKLPPALFIFNIFKSTEEYTNINRCNEYGWEYHFELPEVLH